MPTGTKWTGAGKPGAGESIATPIAGAATATATPAMFGRDTERRLFAEAIDDLLRGRSRLVLVGGEAGIGKTRLADEAAELARSREACVLWGSCWENEGAPPLWPWRRIVAALASKLTPSQLREDLGHDAGVLASAFPELDPGSRAAVPTSPPSSAEVRFGLFEALASFFARVSRRFPLMLVLDDLHWADADSLLLLRVLAREGETARCLIVATWRIADAESRPDTRRAISALARERGSVAIELAGLGRDDVSGLLEAELGSAAAPDAVRQVCEASGGNPFFVRELSRLLGAGRDFAAGFPLPASIRELVTQRLDLLPTPTREALRLAAVAGRRFDVAVLERVRADPGARFVVDLQAAVNARLVTALPAAGFQFVHALVAEVLVAEVPAAVRFEFHGRIAEAIREVHGDDEAWLAALAHHYLQAAAVEDGAKILAVEYSRRAAERATAVAAYDETVAHLERALGALAAVGVQDDAAGLRADLLISLGEAQRWAGLPASVDTFLAAVDLARRQRDAELLARAALGHSAAVGVMPGQANGKVLELMTEAAAALRRDAEGNDRSRLLLARVLARHAVELYWTDESARRLELSREAASLLRDVDPAVERGRILNDHHWSLLGPDTLEERLGLADEILALRIPPSLFETRMFGHVCRITDRLELGDLDAVDADIAAFTREVSTVRQNRLQWWTAIFRGMRQMLEGRLAEAEVSVVSAMTMGERVRSDEAPLHGGAALAGLRDLQGRLAELTPWIEQVTRQYPAEGAWRALLAAAHVEAGREEEARAEVEAVLARDLGSIARDGQWLVTLALLARCCGELGLASPAPRLRRLLEPYRERNVIVGIASCSLGFVSHFLGVLAGLERDREAAVNHFDDAIAAHRRLRAWPLVARSEVENAAALLACGGDRASARALLEEGRARAKALGMKGLEARAAALWAAMGDNVGSPAAAGDEPTPAMRKAGVFRRDGDFWTVAWAGKTVRLRGARGLEHLALLLARPHAAVHSLELAGGTDTGDAGEVLDRRAAAEYRERYAELRRERDRAEEDADRGRLARLDGELDELAAQLAAGLGLGGRDRRAAAASERARVSVAKALRSSVDRIAKAHPDLGAHLRVAVRTGTTCVYAPDPAHPVDWDTGGS